MQVACLTTSSGCGRDLAPVGRSASSGGYFRQPFLSAERELASWFEEQCAARGLTVERDGVGNLVAWWEARRRAGRGASPARTWTPCWTAERTTGRSGWSPPWRRSTCCGRGGSRRRGRSGSRCSWRRRGRGSGWRAWARGWPTGAVSWERRPRAARPGRGVPGRRSRGGRSRRARRAPRCWTAWATFVELHVEQGRDLVDRARRGRGGERDLAARALPLRVPRRRRPRRHDAHGGPRRPDAHATR